jgi:hypothetical protein
MPISHTNLIICKDFKRVEEMSTPVLGGAWKVYQDKKEMLMQEIELLKTQLHEALDTNIRLVVQSGYTSLALKASNNVNSRHNEVVEEMQAKIFKSLSNSLEKDKEINRLNYLAVAQRAAHYGLLKYVSQLESTKEDYNLINERLQERLCEAEEEVCALNDIFERNSVERESMIKKLKETTTNLSKVEHAKSAQDKHVCLLVKEKDRLYDEIHLLKSSKFQCQKCVANNIHSSNSGMKQKSNNSGNPDALHRAEGGVLYKTSETPPLAGQEETPIKMQLQTITTTPKSTNNIDSNKKNTTEHQQTPLNIENKNTMRTNELGVHSPFPHCSPSTLDQQLADHAYNTPDGSSLSFIDSHRKKTPLSFSSGGSKSKTQVNISPSWKVLQLQKLLEQAKVEVSKKDALIKELQNKNQELLTRYRNHVKNASSKVLICGGEETLFITKKDSFQPAKRTRETTESNKNFQQDINSILTDLSNKYEEYKKVMTL